MKYNKLTRRFFLQGVGGSLLSLPLLPSLMPKAYAGLTPSDKFLVMIGSGHGGTGVIGDWLPMPILNSNALLSQLAMFPTGDVNNIDHIIRHAKLQDLLTANAGHAGGNLDAGAERISYILGSFLNPYIGKMNLFRGVDAGSFYSGHSKGIFTGNIAEAVNNTAAAAGMEGWPSLDQFIANSPNFYKNPELISQKTFTNNGTMGYTSTGDAIPETASRLDRAYKALFEKYDKTLTPAQVAQRNKKEYLVDRVYQDYKRFLRGAHGPARTISSVDKIRVEEHVSNLFDIQNKYKNVINSCGDVPSVNETASFGVYNNPTKEAYDVFTDMLASAFSCGATRLSGLFVRDNANNYSGNYHQDIVHTHGSNPSSQLTHNTNFRWHAEHVVSQVVKKLDAISVDGQSGSILDNGLVMWTHECGPKTHSHASLGFTTFGSLGGHFKTGNYLDYRNQANMGLLNRDDDGSRPGVLVQRVWANIIQGFGFSRADYERGGRPGYSDSTVNDFPKHSASTVNKGHHAYPARMFNSLSDKLPIIT